MNKPYLKPMNKTFFTLLLALSHLLGLSATDQQLKLAVTFTDNMILQRELKVPVWGFRLQEVASPVMNLRSPCLPFLTE
jgi:hypothetical protein